MEMAMPHELHNYRLLTCALEWVRLETQCDALCSVQGSGGRCRLRYGTRD